MPSKHVIRSFHNEGYYHIYNRGVAKQNVFMDDQDYKVFLYYLRSFLSPPDMIDVEEPFYDQRRLSYYLQVSLLSYCLMPNHFHMFIKQELDSGISNFMRSLSNAYTKYFNNKYDRVGPVFQGRFKAAEIKSESYLMHITRYIHQNPLDLDLAAGLEEYPYSSYKYYLINNEASPEWLNTTEVLSLFKGMEDYVDFMNQKRLKTKDELSDVKID